VSTVGQDRVLWELEGQDGPPLRCVMRSCCTGAELQLLRGDRVVLQELYPDKPTLYERAAELRQESLEVGPPAGEARNSQ
jgi:hypothetical protein